MTSQWMPREQWEALKAGDGCPMCQAVVDPALAVPGHVDEYGRTIACLDASVLRLQTDQFSRGYCVLMSTQHGPELFDLDEEHRSRLFNDTTRASRAIASAVGADKMNIEFLGNLIPHCHGHIVPRRYGDPAPGARLLRNHEAPIILPADEHAALAVLIAEALN